MISRRICLHAPHLEILTVVSSFISHFVSFMKPRDDFSEQLEDETDNTRIITNARFSSSSSSSSASFQPPPVIHPSLQPLLHLLLTISPVLPLSVSRSVMELMTLPFVSLTSALDTLPLSAFSSSSYSSSLKDASHYSLFDSALMIIQMSGDVQTRIDRWSSGVNSSALIESLRQSNSESEKEKDDEKKASSASSSSKDNDYSDEQFIFEKLPFLDACPSHVVGSVLERFLMKIWEQARRSMLRNEEKKRQAKEKRYERDTRGRKRKVKNDISANPKDPNESSSKDHSNEYGEYEDDDEYLRKWNDATSVTSHQHKQNGCWCSAVTVNEDFSSDLFSELFEENREDKERARLFKETLDEFGLSKFNSPDCIVVQHMIAFHNLAKSITQTLLALIPFLTENPPSSLLVYFIAVFTLTPFFVLPSVIPPLLAALSSPSLFDEAALDDLIAAVVKFFVPKKRAQYELADSNERNEMCPSFFTPMSICRLRYIMSFSLPYCPTPLHHYMFPLPSHPTVSDARSFLYMLLWKLRVVLSIEDRTLLTSSIDFMKLDLNIENCRKKRCYVLLRGARNNQQDQALSFGLRNAEGVGAINSKNYVANRRGGASDDEDDDTSDSSIGSNFIEEEDLQFSECDRSALSFYCATALWIYDDDVSSKKRSSDKSSDIASSVILYKNSNQDSSLSAVSSCSNDSVSSSNSSSSHLRSNRDFIASHSIDDVYQLGNSIPSHLLFLSSIPLVPLRKLLSLMTRRLLFLCTIQQLLVISINPLHNFSDWASRLYVLQHTAIECISLVLVLSVFCSESYSVDLIQLESPQSVFKYLSSSQTSLIPSLFCQSLPYLTNVFSLLIPDAFLSALLFCISNNKYSSLSTVQFPTEPSTFVFSVLMNQLSCALYLVSYALSSTSLSTARAICVSFCLFAADLLQRLHKSALAFAALSGIINSKLKHKSRLSIQSILDSIHSVTFTLLRVVFSVPSNCAVPLGVTRFLSLSDSSLILLILGETLISSTLSSPLNNIPSEFSVYSCERSDLLQTLDRTLKIMQQTTETLKIIGKATELKQTNDVVEQSKQLSDAVTLLNHVLQSVKKSIRKPKIHKKRKWETLLGAFKHTMKQEIVSHFTDSVHFSKKQNESQRSTVASTATPSYETRRSPFAIAPFDTPSASYLLPFVQHDVVSNQEEEEDEEFEDDEEDENVFVGRAQGNLRDNSKEANGKGIARDNSSNQSIQLKRMHRTQHLAQKLMAKRREKKMKKKQKLLMMDEWRFAAKEKLMMNSICTSDDMMASEETLLRHRLWIETDGNIDISTGKRYGSDEDNEVDDNAHSEEEQPTKLVEDESEEECIEDDENEARYMIFETQKIIFHFYVILLERMIKSLYSFLELEYSSLINPSSSSASSASSSSSSTPCSSSTMLTASSSSPPRFLSNIINIKLPRFTKFHSPVSILSSFLCTSSVDLLLHPNQCSCPMAFALGDIDRLPPEKELASLQPKMPPSFKDEQNFDREGKLGSLGQYSEADEMEKQKEDEELAKILFETNNDHTLQKTFSCPSTLHLPFFVPSASFLPAVAAVVSLTPVKHSISANSAMLSHFFSPSASDGSDPFGVSVSLSASFDESELSFSDIFDKADGYSDEESDSSHSSSAAARSNRSIPCDEDIFDSSRRKYDVEQEGILIPGDSPFLSFFEESTEISHAASSAASATATSFTPTSASSSPSSSVFSQSAGYQSDSMSNTEGSDVDPFSQNYSYSDSNTSAQASLKNTPLLLQSNTAKDEDDHVLIDDDLSSASSRSLSNNSSNHSHRASESSNSDVENTNDDSKMETNEEEKLFEKKKEPELFPLPSTISPATAASLQRSIGRMLGNSLEEVAEEDEEELESEEANSEDFNQKQREINEILAKFQKDMRERGEKKRIAEREKRNRANDRFEEEEDDNDEYFCKDSGKSIDDDSESQKEIIHSSGKEKENEEHHEDALEKAEDYEDSQRRYQSDTEDEEDYHSSRHQQSSEEYSSSNREREQSESAERAKEQDDIDSLDELLTPPLESESDEDWSINEEMIQKLQKHNPPFSDYSSAEQKDAFQSSGRQVSFAVPARPKSSSCCFPSSSHTHSASRPPLPRPPSASSRLTHPPHPSSAHSNLPSSHEMPSSDEHVTICEEAERNAVTIESESNETSLKTDGKVIDTKEYRCLSAPQRHTHPMDAQLSKNATAGLVIKNDNIQQSKSVYLNPENISIKHSVPTRPVSSSAITSDSHSLSPSLNPILNPPNCGNAKIDSYDSSSLVVCPLPASLPTSPRSFTYQIPKHSGLAHSSSHRRKIPPRPRQFKRFMGKDGLLLLTKEEEEEEKRWREKKGKAKKEGKDNSSEEGSEASEDDLVYDDVDGDTDAEIDADEECNEEEEAEEDADDGAKVKSKECNDEEGAKTQSRAELQNVQTSSALDEEAQALCSAETSSKTSEEEDDDTVYLYVKGEIDRVDELFQHSPEHNDGSSCFDPNSYKSDSGVGDKSLSDPPNPNTTP